MPLQKIVAHLECDKCGEPFTTKIPNDAPTDRHPTIFEIVTEQTDVAQRKDSRHYEEAYYEDGEFFGPCCAPEKIEEAWIKDIKNGKVTREALEKMGDLEQYEKYLPQPQLEAS